MILGLDINDVTNYLYTCPHLDNKTEIRTDYSEDKPIDYGLHDGGKKVLPGLTTITGIRTFRHTYTLISVHDTSSQTKLKANNLVTHTLQDWFFEQHDAKNYPPITGGAIERIESSESIFMGFVGDTKSGRYQTVFFIDYEEVK